MRQRSFVMACLLQMASHSVLGIGEQLIVLDNNRISE